MRILWKNGPSLGARFVILSICLVAACVAILIATVFSIARGRLREEVQGETELLVSSMNWAVAPLLSAHDMASIQRLVENTGSHPSVKNIRLYDASGTVLASNLPGEVGKAIPERVLDDVLSLHKSEAMFEDFPRNEFMLAVPVRSEPPGGGDTGFALFLRPNIALEKQDFIPFARTIVLSTVGVATLLILLFSLMLYRWIILPLNSLSRATSAVADGAPDVRAPIGLPGQIGSLAGLFNAMLEEIAEKNRALRTYTESLESKVQERTRSLSGAYEDLKRAQGRLVQAARMASVGQLAAGVAHEINNPMGYIKSNLTAMRRYAATLKDFTSCVLAGGTPQQPNWRSEMELVMNDLLPLVDESLEGAARVESIVRSLKGFSHVDTGEISYLDINGLLDDTVRVSWNQIKDKATVEKSYGDLPLVRCYPQRLNQVFLNLLLNAAESITRDGLISMATRREEDTVIVTIGDNGCGIPAEALPRIFEPFFTTKDPGKGTGLGLSISYDIVKNHGGEISVESDLGKGTRFVVALPVNGSSEWKR